MEKLCHPWRCHGYDREHGADYAWPASSDAVGFALDSVRPRSAIFDKALRTSSTGQNELRPRLIGAGNSPLAIAS